jgi:hypothetical protein
MHGGVQFICPAMHGDGAKRVRFKKIQTWVKFKICFKFGLKIKKIWESQVREGMTAKEGLNR